MVCMRVQQECADLPGLVCVPATIDLAGAEIELVSLVARETRLQRAVASYVEERAAAYVTPAISRASFTAIPLRPCRSR